MLPRPRITELAQRDRFVRRAVSEGRVVTFADEQSACVPSQKWPNTTVQLFWSNPAEAERWGEALTGDGALQEIPLQAFASDILPGLAMAKGLAGTDWISDPIEAEIDPKDLILRLKVEAVPAFIKMLLGYGEVYLVADAEGPVLQRALQRGGSGRAFPVFMDRAEADRHILDSGDSKIIIAPISDFLASTLPWALTQGHTIAIEPIKGAGPLELPAEDLRGRLAAA